MTLSTVCGAVLGVQRPEDEVPGLRRRHGERDGLEVAHLAHEYHVGVLPQTCFRAWAKLLVSWLTSRWLTMHCLCSCRNSMGPQRS